MLAEVERQKERQDRAAALHAILNRANALHLTQHNLSIFWRDALHTLDWCASQLQSAQIRTHGWNGQGTFKTMRDSMDAMVRLLNQLLRYEMEAMQNAFA